MTKAMELGDWDYTARDLVDGLGSVGIGSGDTVFVHFCGDSLGQLKDCHSGEEFNETIFNSLLNAVGREGTVLIPTYTFSFCNQEEFEIRKTPTKGGPWSTSASFLEYFRRQPGVVRSGDPIHSVAGLGPRAEELLTNLPHTCFGEDSVHHRLLQVGGKICTIGVGLHESSFRHYVEEIAGIPTRFKKLFTGYVREGGQTRKLGWVYNVPILAENCYSDGSRLEQKARDTGKCRVAPLGRGEMLGITARDFFDFTMQELNDDSWCTVKGPAGDPVKMEEARVGRRAFDISLPQNASMVQMIDALWSLPRDIISDGYDAALEALAGQVPMTIHEYPSGTECWSWIVPEKWTCHEAYLETLDGRRLFSYQENPLHVVSYSLPFAGEVTREELLRHLHVHPKIADAIPFIFKYYDRDWGLCCSKTLRDSLSEERYRVVIRSDFSYGTLKIGEVVVPGKSDESIVLCSHLCHPHQVNDDMTGVVVGVDVVRELFKRKDLRYTYRYLILPETIGGVAYLSHREQLFAKMKGGLFLEMLGLENPHGLQMSFAGNTDVDRCFDLAMKKHDFHSWTGDFRTIIGNDERQFNAPGVRVPMLSLSRVLPPSAPNWPYREYHSSYDSPDLLSLARLEDSRDLVLEMIDALEANVVPNNNFKGEVFCSRYGLHVDAYANPEGNKALFDMLDRVDGTRTIADIAVECGVSFNAVKDTLDQFERFGLVSYQS